LPELPCGGVAQVAAQVGAGSYFGHGGSGTLAVWSVWYAILRAAGAGAAFVLCALLHLREFGFAGNFARICGRRDGGIVEIAAGSRSEMRTLPEQIFYDSTEDEGKAKAGVDGSGVWRRKVPGQLALK